MKKVIDHKNTQIQNSFKPSKNYLPNINLKIYKIVKVKIINISDLNLMQLLIFNNQFKEIKVKHKINYK